MPLQAGSPARPFYGLVVAAGCWLALGAAHLFGLFTLFDLRLGDLRFHIRGTRPASDQIALVEVDDATVRAYGRWPLPRDAYALLIAMLEEAGARAIGLDIQFPAPDPDDPRSDDVLAGVTATSPAIVHAVSFFAEEPARGPDHTEAEGLLERHGLPMELAGVPEAGSVSASFPRLARAARSIGHVTVAVDPDGVIRRLPPLVRYHGRLFGSMSLRLVGVSEGDTTFPALRATPGGIEVTYSSGRRTSLPLDREGATSLDFAGDRSAFRHRYSAFELLSWFRDGQLDSIRRAVDGRIVLIGATAVGEVATDIGATPFSPSTPLLYVHANAVDSWLRGRSLKPVPDALSLFALGLVALVFGLLFTRLPLPVAAGVMAGGVALLALVLYGSFAIGGWNLPSTVTLALLPVAYSATGSYRFLFLERHARERDRELQVARKIQQKLLPVDPPQAPTLDVHGFNIPAQEVGGDYFDWIELGSDTLIVALGDVSGKGVAAALLMSHLRASLHAESRPGRPPHEVAQAMNLSLSRAVDPGRFATFFLASIPFDGDGMTYCNAGHNPGLILRGDRVEWLKATGIPLGAMEDSTYDARDCRLETGDVLVLYSDGVTECPYREDFYGEERLEALVRGCDPGASARSIAEAILADVRRFARGPLGADDITVIVARRR